MKKLITTFLSASLLLATSVNAEDKHMTADEVKATFTGKTCDGFNEEKGKGFQIYMADDGTMLHKNPKRTKKAKWKVTEDGKHCGILGKRVCGHIVSKGDGVYHKIKDDEHTHTYKNCVDGNNL